MSEFTERLREHAALHEVIRDEEQQQWGCDLREAADTIERLTAQLDHAVEQAAKNADEVLRLREERDMLREDAERYRWLRAGRYTWFIARKILNDTPHGIDASIDAAQKGEA